MHLKLFPMSSSKEKPVRRIRCPVKRHIRSDCTPPSLSAPHCAAHLTSPLQQSHFFLTHWFDPFCDRIRLSVRLVCAPKRTVGNCSSERLWLLQTTECLNPSNCIAVILKMNCDYYLQIFLSNPKSKQKNKAQHSPRKTSPPKNHHENNKFLWGYL